MPRRSLDNISLFVEKGRKILKTCSLYKQQQDKNGVSGWSNYCFIAEEKHKQKFLVPFLFVRHT